MRPGKIFLLLAVCASLSGSFSLSVPARTQEQPTDSRAFSDVWLSLKNGQEDRGDERSEIIVRENSNSEADRQNPEAPPSESSGPAESSDRKLSVDEERLRDDLGQGLPADEEDQEDASDQDLIIDEDRQRDASDQDLSDDKDALRDEEEFVIPETDDGRSFIISMIPLWAFNYIDRQMLTDISANTEPLGDSGRLFIPRVDVDVAVNYAWEGDGEKGQQLGDQLDSAVYTPHNGGEPYIADHWNQGFIGIRFLQTGDLAYWKHSDRIDVLYCVLAFQGINDGYFILNELGENCYFLNEGGLLTYTCNQDWQHVSCGFWQPIATIWF